MSFEGKNILAVVPARGGSKSIPYKNLSKVGGISLVGIAGNLLSSINWLDAKVLSTDDKKIATEGIQHGLEVPMMRPEYLSSDTATSLDMWQYMWLECEKFYEKKFDISILIEPTSPLRVVDDIERSVKALIFDGASAAVTVSRTPAHFTPQKTLTVNEQDNIEYFIGLDGKKFHNRQSIPSYYHRNGACYAVTRKHLIEEGKIIEGAKAIIIDRPLVNIDDPIELEFANFFFDYLSKKETRKDLS